MSHGKFVLISKGAGTRVFSHPQIVKDQAYIEHELSHFLRDAAASFGFDDANGKTSQASHVFRAMALAYPAAVFGIVPIDNVMTAVFDAPVAAGNAIGDFTGVFTAFFICELPLDDESLSEVRKVQIAVEFGCGPNFADFDAAVIRWVALNKIGVLAVFKI